MERRLRIAVVGSAMIRRFPLSAAAQANTLPQPSTGSTWFKGRRDFSTAGGLGWQMPVVASVIIGRFPLAAAVQANTLPPPSTWFQGRRRISTAGGLGGEMPVISQLMFTNQETVANERWVTPREYLKQNPPLYRVGVTGGLIRPIDLVDRPKYMLAATGRKLLKSGIRLGTANLARGRNIAELITEDNLKVSTTQGELALMGTDMKNEKRGEEDNHLVYKAVSTLFQDLVKESYEDPILESDLLPDLSELYGFLAKSSMIDKRRITNHPALLSWQGHMGLIVKINYLLRQEVSMLGNQEKGIREVVCGMLPYLDGWNWDSFKETHPMVKSWCEHSRKLRAKLGKNPQPPRMHFSLITSGKLLVALHRDAVLHPFGPVEDGVAPISQYSLIEVVELLHFLFPMFCPTALKLIIEKGLWEKVEMNNFFPEVSTYADWTDFEKPLAP